MRRIFNEAYIKLLEFVHDCDLRLKDQEYDCEMRLQLQECLNYIVRLCDQAPIGVAGADRDRVPPV